MTARRFALIVTLVVLALPFAVAADEPADKSAGEVVGKFLEAVKGRDLDGVLKVAEAPWFHKGDQVIREREGLKKEFESLFAKRDFKALTFEVKKIVPYSAVREKTMGEERKLLDEVLTADDRVVLVEVNTEKKGKENIVLLVRLKEGKAKVVGIKD